MKNMTIRQRIMGSFACILALLGILVAVTQIYLNRIEGEARVILVDSTPGTIYSANIQANLLQNYARVQRHLRVDDSIDLQKNADLILATRNLQQETMRRYEATIFQAEDRALYNTFVTAINAYWVAQERLLKLSATQKGKDLYAFVDGEVQPAFEKTRSILNTMISSNEKYTLASIRKINDSIASTTQIVTVGMLFIFLLALGAGYLLLRAVTGPLTRMVGALDLMRQGDFTGRMNLERNDEFGIVADGFNRMTDELAGLVGQVQKSGLQVTTSVTEIAATSRQQQATATEIAATTAEIGATSKEISASSRQLVKTMTEVSAVADHSAVLAGSGKEALQHMGETMRHVMEATQAINTKLVVLNEKAGNINQVITTISKVAEQTNLLSLNAAIEAEKAGEHGRGFSVVAIEIRRLADQTAVATYDIGQTVKEIQGAVSSSVMGMDKFSDQVRRGLDEVHQISGQLSEIIQQVQTLAPRVEDVNDGIQAQASGAEQITEALAQLNESAQQTVDSLRQSSMAIDELNQVANGLRGGVSRFKLKA